MAACWRMSCRNQGEAIVLDVAAARPGFYVVHVDRPESQLPLLRLRVACTGSPTDEPVVLPALASTDYLSRLVVGAARFSFADTEVTATSIRPAHAIDFLRAVERPRVSARLRLSLNDDLTM